MTSCQGWGSPSPVWKQIFAKSMPCVGCASTPDFVWGCISTLLPPIFALSASGGTFRQAVKGACLDEQEHEEASSKDRICRWVRGTQVLFTGVSWRPTAQPSVHEHQCENHENGDDHVFPGEVDDFLIMPSEQISHKYEFTDAEQNTGRIKEGKSSIFYTKDARKRRGDPGERTAEPCQEDGPGPVPLEKVFPFPVILFRK